MDQSGKRKMDDSGRLALDVLLIEDSTLDVELAVRELERDSFTVSWKRVEMESDLRDILESSAPDVVISDYTMPKFDGIKALKIVREMTPQVPFIFLSGTIGEERAIESIREGATDYVLKSNMRRLPIAVRRALSDAEDRARADAIERDRKHLAAILETTSDCVAMFGPDGDLIYLNAAGRELTGLVGRELEGINVSSLHPPSSWKMISEKGWPAAKKKGLWHGETTMLAADNTEVPMSQVIIAHRRPDGGIEYLSTIARDIRERKTYEERIAYLANYDALTDLPNRALLNDRTVQAISYERHGARSLAVLVVDIDRFKLVNDGYGQNVGDELLRMMGDRLRSAVRDGDTVARLSADSYAILAVNLAHPDDILTIARKIQATTGKPFSLGARELRLTVSMGASVFPRDGEDFDTLLRNADSAMHRAKSEGRDGFRLFVDDMTSDAADRVNLESDLRVAIDRGELAMHYQPQLSLESRRVVGVEALMRWKHPERGWVSPEIFIPIAEHSDLIHSLGEWALLESCRQLKRWGGNAAGLRMAVNVSARQFRNPGFTDTVARAIETSGIDPTCLELELTESVLVNDQGETARTLDSLKTVGVKIAVDDFGTGYSSLSYLSRLPIDCLKIDRVFLRNIPGEPHDTAIVQAIISLANSMMLDVIAEGIENNEQLLFLRNQGCSEGQGFFFGKPVPSEKIENLLRRDDQN